MALSHSSIRVATEQSKNNSKARKFMHFQQIFSQLKFPQTLRFLFSGMLVFMNIVVSEDLSQQPSFSSSYCVPGACFSLLFFALRFYILHCFSSVLLIPLWYNRILTKTLTVKVYLQDASFCFGKFSDVLCFLGCILLLPFLFQIILTV